MLYSSKSSWLLVASLFVGSSQSSTAATLPVLEERQQRRGDGECLIKDDGSADCESSDASSNSHSDDSEAFATDTPAPSSFQCSLYMAPSTIPGAGLGIFTGVERNEGDTVGDGDILIPISDQWYHLQVSEFYNGYYGAAANLDPTTDYVWFGPEMGMQHESSNAAKFVTAFAPGLDAAINCNLALINVDKDVPVYDTAGLHRSRDAGVGAFSPYHNCTTHVTAHIPAGGELFKFYGENWFVSREKKIGLVPLVKNFPRAEDLIRTFTEKISPRRFSQELRSDAYDLMKGFALPSRTIQALPNNLSHTQNVVDSGIRAYYQQFAVRTIEELEHTGRCIDTIYPGPSTLPQAGRGAFAKKEFIKGEVITGTPLLYTFASDFFRQYHGDWSYLESTAPDRTRFRGFSIAINYCWHHASASLFLCPYGYEVNYINHNQTRANVKMQWSVDGIMGHKAHLLETSPEAIGELASPGLIMDLVATQDIRPGEELFLDYGNAWEDAWQRHLVRFQQKQQHYVEYISARDWNEQNEAAIIRTKPEQSMAPYPSNLQLHCLDEGEDVVRDANVAKTHWSIDSTGSLCQVAARRTDESGKVLYKVWFEKFEQDEEGSRIVSREWHKSEWIVREAMQMVDKPYSTDMWLEEAFRHPIGIPDNVFPDAWRGFNKTKNV